MAYNRLVITPLLPGVRDIKDTQNAFKAFRRNVLDRILPLTIDKRFAFDAELLMLARKEGYKLLELGMPWVDTPERTTVTMSQGIKMAKSILEQRKNFKNDAHHKKADISRRRLVLQKGEQTRSFLIIAPLYYDDHILLAEDERTEELFVIKKLLTPEMEDHAFFVTDFLKRVPEDYPYTYKPEIMSAGENMWAGLDDAQAIVYPYFAGQSFEDRFKHLSEVDVLGRFGIELLDMVLKASDVASYLESKGVPWVWDINPGNIIIKADDKPYFLDYTMKRVSPVDALHWLIYCVFQKSGAPNTEAILNNISFTNSMVLNKAIRDRLTELFQKVKTGDIKTVANFRDELKKVRDYTAMCVLEDSNPSTRLKIHRVNRIDNNIKTAA